MKKIILFILIFTSFLQAQEKIFIGDKVYSKTKNWDFSCNNSGGSMAGDIKVSIAKDGVNGLIILSMTLYALNDCNIKGNVILYLSDDSVIKCVNRGKKDLANGLLTSVFNLNNTEINRLSQHRVVGIRFTLKDQFDSQNFIANNEKSEMKFRNGEFVTIKSYYNTNIEIAELFSK